MSTERFDLRDGGIGDVTALERLYAAALPDEDLRPLVQALLRHTPGVLSLVAMAASGIVGHVAFTPCRVTGDRGGVSLLGPLAVAPAWRKQGIGGRLVRAGLGRVKSAGARQAFVLGDPAYYGRFGFRAERLVAPPFPLPETWREAWQSVRLERSGAPEPRGTFRETLAVPPAWDKPVLWGA